MSSRNYFAIYRAIADMLHSSGLTGTDAFICKCIKRVQEDADEDWNEFDVKIAITNELNETIENYTLLTMDK